MRYKYSRLHKRVFQPFQPDFADSILGCSGSFRRGAFHRLFVVDRPRSCAEKTRKRSQKVDSENEDCDYQQTHLAVGDGSALCGAAVLPLSVEIRRTVSIEG